MISLILHPLNTNIEPLNSQCKELMNVDKYEGDDPVYCIVALSLCNDGSSLVLHYNVDSTSRPQYRKSGLRRLAQL